MSADTLILNCPEYTQYLKDIFWYNKLLGTAALIVCLIAVYFIFRMIAKAMNE